MFELIGGGVHGRYLSKYYLDFLVLSLLLLLLRGAGNHMIVPIGTAEVLCQ